MIINFTCKPTVEEFYSIQLFNEEAKKYLAMSPSAQIVFLNDNIDRWDYCDSGSFNYPDDPYDLEEIP